MMILLMVIISFNIFSLSPAEKPNDQKNDEKNEAIALSKKIVRAIMKKDMKTIESMIYKDSELDFITNYRGKNATYNKFKKDSVSNILKSNAKVTKWDYELYSGYPIHLTMNEFLDRYNFIDWFESKISVMKKEDYKTDLDLNVLNCNF